MALRERILTPTAAMLVVVCWLVMSPATIRAGYVSGAGPRTPAGAAAPSAAVGQSPPALSCRVGPGDTLSAIAVRYGVMVDQLIRANHLTDPADLAVGENLVIPVTAPVPGNPLAARVTRSLPWPVAGPVSSPFGWRIIFGHREFHTGIDIAAQTGTPIRAPLAGRVVFAGPLGTYGLAVIIDHGAGFSTLYAHAEGLLVGPGQAVAAGQAIALVGETGDATGPHLHFETRVDGQPENPLVYLASR